MCLAEENTAAAEFNAHMPEDSMFTFCDDSIGSYDCSSLNSTPENLSDLEDLLEDFTIRPDEDEAPLSSTPRIKLYGSINYHEFVMQSMLMSPIVPQFTSSQSPVDVDSWNNSSNSTDKIEADTITDYYSYFSASSRTTFTPKKSLVTATANFESTADLSFDLPSSDVTFQLDWGQIAAKRRCVRKLF